MKLACRIPTRSQPVSFPLPTPKKEEAWQRGLTTKSINICTQKTVLRSTGAIHLPLKRALSGASLHHDPPWRMWSPLFLLFVDALPHLGSLDTLIVSSTQQGWGKRTSTSLCCRRPGIKRSAQRASFPITLATLQLPLWGNFPCRNV